jgi:two-component system sensor histidine kinase/response regulator
MRASLPSAGAGQAAANILVVDDSPDNLQLLCDMLLTQGHHARLCSESRLALQTARAEPPELILLDINMPVMNGYEVCACLKSDPKLKDIPVIFLSAMAEIGDKMRAFQVGGVDYITKPFQLDELAVRVRTQLELGRQKAALQDNYQRLRDLEQLRDNLVHMIVHDLRAPLSGIQMSLDLLQTDLAPTQSQASSLLQKARLGLSQLSRMVTQLLDISRLEAGQMPLRQSQSDLGQTARSAMDSTAVFAGARSTHLFLPHPVRVFHDAEIVRRIIENLLINAFKFSPEQSEVRLEITHDDGTARIALTDQGPGIPAAHHRKIFEKFAHVNSDHKQSGAGLGLTFCKLAVEAHGGRIGVTSEAGSGNTFWFTLPSRPRDRTSERRPGADTHRSRNRDFLIPHPDSAHAPNLSNIFALACMRRIRYFASNTPSDPVLAPVSVNRSSLSEPQQAE